MRLRSKFKSYICYYPFRFGEIGDVYIPMDFRTRSSKSFGFVRFVHKDDAEASVKGLAGFELNGSPIEVNLAMYGREDKRVKRRSRSRSRGNGRDAGRDRYRSRSRERRPRYRSESRDRRRRSRSRSGRRY